MNECRLTGVEFEISKIHRNFVAVEEIKTNLAHLDAQLSKVNQMLDEDVGDGTLTSHPLLYFVANSMLARRVDKPNAKFAAYPLCLDKAPGLPG